MSIVKDRRCLVTGKVPGYSRTGAQGVLRDLGAIIETSLSAKTDLMIVGEAPGPAKLVKAESMGVDVVRWEDALADNYAPVAASAPRAPLPSVRQWTPMLCQPADVPPVGHGWIYEMKWDGQRGVATLTSSGVVIQSRTGKTDLTGRYPDVVSELVALHLGSGHDCVLDGELVDSGYMVFDILSADGLDVTGWPLRARRKLLGELIVDGNRIGISPAFDDGAVLLRHVKKIGAEGIVAKRLSSKYVEGGRGPEWQKVKVRREQEFVVLGYTPGEGHREWAFGALILGYYGGEEIRYAGKVGTGFDDDCLAMLMQEMEPMICGETCGDERSWIVPNNVKKGAIWLYPGIVVQVAFQRWTEDGRLWHPSYQGLRTDKEAHEVVRET